MQESDSARDHATATLDNICVAMDVMVPMRDGVRLATDIYRPAFPDGSPRPGRFPVLLTRTSYDKSNPVMQVEPVGKYFARRGYVVAIQDLRGRGNSEGVGDYHHRANPREGTDGYDTIEWLATQPWSTGRVGMVGSSHSGCVQNVAAIHRPPHLSALWVDVAPITAHGWESRSGGAQRLHMVPALFLHAYDAAEIRADPVARKRIEDGAMAMRGFLQHMPFKRAHTPLAAVPNLEAVLMRYQNFDGLDPWWTQEVLDQKSRLDRYADVPTVFSTGWYDCFVAEVTWQFAEMARRSSAPQRLIVGPWNHGGMRAGASRIGEVEFGAAAAWGNAVYNPERLRWFDRWLKDAPTGVDTDPPVRLFVMGGGAGARRMARSRMAGAGSRPRHGRLPAPARPTSCSRPMAASRRATPRYPRRRSHGRTTPPARCRRSARRWPPSSSGCRFPTAPIPPICTVAPACARSFRMDLCTSARGRSCSDAPRPSRSCHSARTSRSSRPSRSPRMSRSRARSRCGSSSRPARATRISPPS
jgi:hypothetical protein